MNRTDRLLAILLELQGKGQLRAEDLAATFETSKRTIYRDVQALSEAGVPVVSVPGQGYSLMPGYFLPPVNFNTDEAIMLLLGSDFMAQNFDARYRAAAQSAGRKIEAVLPPKLRDEAHYLQSSIRFISMDTAENPAIPDRLQQLRRALVECRSVRFRYQARQSEKPAHREADPYGLVNISNTWYLVAYCHTRRGRRNFRLDRMDDLQLLSKAFTRPANFTLEPEPDRQRNLIVRAVFDYQIARWVQEAPSYFATVQEQRPDGLHITFTVRHESDILQWLLGWGRHVHVLEPESLRRQFIAEAEGILRIHRPDKTLLT